MEVPQDETFREERERFALRWNCEDCALFDDKERCVHGFPTHRHRRSRYLDPSAPILICKEFDLG
ncbi:MAG: hypothetical protein IPG17_23830 [Sandaracinaceae bacterium]|nr:hypothetical protein [Sandaracinaceae bacterium]MBP7685776.1 hypothetical protein [Deltaproteobacteria bacterium]MBK6812184.1 hypothetical protein [Sandaracinaceae bacterium]MBK7155962.1 hypothetical protein [Sandaracinaceae bacterium]MBK7778127.1 hypothetical protein [Sandaracinaceae bacterium]